jgi:hypothetical protein
MTQTERDDVLRRLAARPDSALAGFAADVLAGRRELRDLYYTSAGADELLADLQPLLEAWRTASDGERENAVASAAT